MISFLAFFAFLHTKCYDMHDIFLPKINILLNFALLMTNFALLLLLPTGSIVLLLPTVTGATILIHKLKHNIPPNTSFLLAANSLIALF